jgi:leucyl-tRNA synthetase
MNDRYIPQQIEPKWQARWAADRLYRTPDTTSGRPKFYCLDFFPYPSGDGLSVGHCRNYIPTDVISRYKRMAGCAVLHPMGWDAFGLPAENEALYQSRHPCEMTARYAANYKRQMNLIGASYDWEREVFSTDPRFYRWTQWFFLLLYRRGLAYRAMASQWWCPVDQTVLANEQVEVTPDGPVCWRGHSGVYKRDLEQWYFKITDYADRLLADLDLIDWPEKIKAMQRHWIGRSEGVEFDLTIDDRRGDPSVVAPVHGGLAIRVFTTRPDTVYGMTFVVLAPEHAQVEVVTTPEQRGAVQSYVERARHTPEIERLGVERERSGIFTGSFAVHPLTGQRVPIWVADYVLPGYGTGAIMAVPAHDARDFHFARQYGLAIHTVIEPGQGEAPGAAPASPYEGEGILVHSGPFTGLPSDIARQRIREWLEQAGIGRRRVNYRMRDWLISRQRYWGAPIPIVYCDDCGIVPVLENQLPVLLPDIARIKPAGDGRSPLANVPEFVNTPCPECGRPARRETDTMDGFACSSWYFLRFTSPDYDAGPFDPAAMRTWLPVDLYVGGAEHAVMHLLYARFWTKVMHDAELVPFVEPFTRLMNQGVVHAANGRRMSKSRRNVVTPDEVVARHGADSLRAFELFMAPFEQNVNWSEAGIAGVDRWLERVWNLVLSTRQTSEVSEDFGSLTRLRRATHRAIQQVTADLEAFKFNTMIAALMEYTNTLVKTRQSPACATPAWDEAIDVLLRLLAPACPHIAEELWARLGKPYSIHQQPWPAWDAALVAEETFTLVVQVDGKVRDRIEAPAGLTEATATALALASPAVQRWLDGREPAQVHYVPGRLVSLSTRTGQDSSPLPLGEG